MNCSSFALFAQCELFALFELFARFELVALFAQYELFVVRTVRRSHCSNSSPGSLFALFVILENKCCSQFAGPCPHEAHTV